MVRPGVSRRCMTSHEVKPASSAAASQIAHRHLTNAIARYREALVLSPENLVARMGLGWCLVQAKQHDEAITVLRDVVARAWPDDRDSKRSVMHGFRSLTEEAARYLIPLLDAIRDKDELAILRERVALLERLPRAITPIAIPLRDGLTASAITDSDARVRFDADGSGLKREWTWITPDAGWLVYDQRGTRRIESALQLFGNVSFWLFWENGYQALRALDDDRDGRLSGKELRHLGLWHDRNRNARSESGEVKPLAHWNIVALGYACERDPAHPDEIVFAPAGVTFRDGSSRPTFDIVLHSRHSSGSRVDVQ